MSELEKPRGQMTPLAFPNSDMVTNLLNVFNEDLALVGFRHLRNCWISCLVWFGNATLLYYAVLNFTLD